MTKKTTPKKSRNPVSTDVLARRFARMETRLNHEIYQIRAMVEQWGNHNANGIHQVGQQQKTMLSRLEFIGRDAEKAASYGSDGYVRTLKALEVVEGHVATTTRHLNSLRNYLVSDFFPKAGDVLVVKEQHLREYPAGAHVHVKHCDTQGYVRNEKGLTFHKDRLRYMTEMETTAMNLTLIDP